MLWRRDSSLLSEMMDMARLKTLSPGVLFQSHTVQKGVVENEKGQSDTWKKVSASAPYRNSRNPETGRAVAEMRADHADRCGIQPGF